MGLFKRAHDIAQAKANKALDSAEKPDEMLDLSYEKMLEQITKIRRALVEIAASRKRIELQEEQLQHSAEHLQDQAKAALGVGREDLAREALSRKAAAQTQIDQMEPQHQQLVDEEARLGHTLQALQTRVNQFRTQKETMKAQYTAAKAITSVNEDAAGISTSIGDSGAALARAQDKIASMQARSGALDELLESGVLEDTGGGNDDIQRELDKIGSTSGVDAELEALKAGLPQPRALNPGEAADGGRVVSTGPDDAYDLDLATASLLADSTDVAMLLQALAKQLADGFGERLTVEHEGGRFHKSDKVKALDVDLGDDAFRAEVAKGQLTCTVAHASGGIRIRSQRVEMDVWLRRLLESLRAEAAHSQSARLALENIVIGGPT